MSQAETAQLPARAVTKSVEENAATLEAIYAAFPKEGLFAEKEWLVSPEPFFLEPRLREELGKLGYRLHLFAKACNTLYHLSITGRQPAWIAEYLDAASRRSWWSSRGSALFATTFRRCCGPTWCSPRRASPLPSWTMCPAASASRAG